MRMMNLTRSWQIIGFLLWSAFPAPAAVHHVSGVTGNDAGDGSEARPWQTIGKAVHSIQPGDTVVVHRGIYRADTFQVGPAGRDSTARTIFMAAPGERVLLTKADGTQSGFGLADYALAICEVNHSFTSTDAHRPALQETREY